MLGTLRFAVRTRIASKAFLYGSRPSLVLPRVNHLALYSNKPTASKTNICSNSKTMINGSKSKVTIKGSADKNKPTCSSMMGGKRNVQKSQTKMCDKGQKATEKDSEESSPKPKKEDSSDESTSSEEELVKRLDKEKECSDAEMSDHSDEEGQQVKAASEMCDCVKEAVAKATGKKDDPSIGRTHDKSPKQEQVKGKQKVDDNFTCCNVEKSKTAREGETQPCKDFKKESNKSNKGKDDVEEAEGKPVSMNNSQCGFIKKALEKFKKVGKPDVTKPDSKSGKLKKEDAKKENLKEKVPKKEKAKEKVPQKETSKKPNSKKPVTPNSIKGKKDCGRK